MSLVTPNEKGSNTSWSLFFVSRFDEAALSRLLLEISLLDSAYQRGEVSQDLLMDAAKRYRVDVEKIVKAVATEFAAKRSKQPKTKASPNPSLCPKQGLQDSGGAFYAPRIFLRRGHGGSGVKTRFFESSLEASIFLPSR